MNMNEAETGAEHNRFRAEDGGMGCGRRVEGAGGASDQAGRSGGAGRVARQGRCALTTCLSTPMVAGAIWLAVLCAIARGAGAGPVLNILDYGAHKGWLG